MGLASRRKVRCDSEREEALVFQSTHRQTGMTYHHSRFFQAVETYCSRAWIAQELAVVRRVVLLLGTAELDLNQLAEEDRLRATRERFELGWYPSTWPKIFLYRI